MTKREDLLSLGFYERSPYTGSDGQMRYRIAKEEDKEAGTKELVCTIWPGPYSFDHTDDADKVSFRADFSEDGMDEIIKELNLRSPDYQEDPRYGIHDGSI
ncbi:MAG: hypothetical protein IIU28_02455 [Lachnospiraceae bacterium]|nr:hypothetical protein [Lachnospiraceae bacterium]